MLIWKTIKETDIRAELRVAGDYVISVRKNGRKRKCVVSYRPPGQHVHVGETLSIKAATEMATRHHDTIQKKAT